MLNCFMFEKTWLQILPMCLFLGRHQPYPPPSHVEQYATNQMLVPLCVIWKIESVSHELPSVPYTYDL